MVEERRRRRGAAIRPDNRFQPTTVEPDPDYAPDPELPDDPRTTYLDDHAKSIMASNDSPDVPFRFSVNPYRGCEHGCTYCYARPTHEMLGFDAGLDFESRIMVKKEAPALLKAALAKPSWKAEHVALSGVTDCYQPAERRFRLTRACLEVLYEAKNPCSIVTKNLLVARDVDLLARMARENLVQVWLSVTSLDPALSRAMEPRASIPAGRLEAIRILAAAGVPVGALVAPVVPGLTDHEMPKILQAVAAAGARSAGYVLLRLPLAVEPIFRDWLRRAYPEKVSRVETLLAELRGGTGKLNDPSFATRMSGTGPFAAQLAQMFRVFARRHGLDQGLPALDGARFQRPLAGKHAPAPGQLELFHSDRRSP